MGVTFKKKKKRLLPFIKAMPLFLNDKFATERHFPRQTLWFLGQYKSNQDLWTLQSSRHDFFPSQGLHASLVGMRNTDSRAPGSWECGLRVSLIPPLTASSQSG